MVVVVLCVWRRCAESDCAYGCIMSQRQQGCSRSSSEMSSTGHPTASALSTCSLTAQFLGTFVSPADESCCLCELLLWDHSVLCWGGSQGQHQLTALLQHCKSEQQHGAECCLHKQDKFQDICRKSFIRVFLFCNDFNFSFLFRKSRAYTGH